jgi:hypothetical protein
MLVGSIACSCGRHLTWRCECGTVTYGPALAEGRSLLDGLARVRGRHAGAWFQQGFSPMTAKRDRLGAMALAGSPDYPACCQVFSAPLVARVLPVPPRVIVALFRAFVDDRDPVVVRRRPRADLTDLAL